MPPNLNVYPRPRGAVIIFEDWLCFLYEIMHLRQNIISWNSFSNTALKHIIYFTHENNTNEILSQGFQITLTKKVPCGRINIHHQSRISNEYYIQ